MPASSEWLAFFEHNARSLREIPWHLGAELTSDEVAATSASLQEFQLGENSEGKHLMRYAHVYADATGDFAYVTAMRLFIAEEQRHARDLGRFLKQNGIPLIRSTPTDRLFRKLRNCFGGLETSIAVLITAEIIAKVYYLAIQRATRSKILHLLCEQILSDEYQHVCFQSQQLAKLRAEHRRPVRGLLAAFQQFLFLGAVCLVWQTHRRALKAGGFSRVGWWKACWMEYSETFAASALTEETALRGAIIQAPTLADEEPFPDGFDDSRRTSRIQERAMRAK